MRLAEGIEIDKEKTFGEMKFSSIRRVNYKADDSGKPTTEIKGRTYDLKSRIQQQMIQVQLPPEVSVKDFKVNDIVDIIEPEISSFADRRTAVSVIRVKDIVLKGTPHVKPTPQTRQTPEKT